MDNEEFEGVKFSEFPSATPDNADEVVGLHAGDNARFTVANFILAIRQGLANLFVPLTRTINNKALSSDITLNASDVGAYKLPSGGIPKADLAQGVQDSLDAADSAYQLPSGGIPDTDLDSAVQTSLGLADTAYQLPAGGIPSSDMASAVQTSLGKADTAYQKPSGGIPASDLASGVIPAVPSASDAVPQDLGTAAAGSSADYSRADHVHKMPTAGDVGAIPTSARGAAGGVASLGASGKVPTSQLPSIPSAATENPEMDGFVGDVGVSTKYAREDHSHPENYRKFDQIQVANTESSSIASQAYAVGQYFNKLEAEGIGGEIHYYYNLCRVTAPIPSGGTLTENTNYVVTTIADELPYLQNTVLQSTGVTVTFTRKTADITASNLISVFSRGNASENYHLIGMWVSNKFITFSVAGGLSVTSSSTGSLQISVPAAASNIAMTSVGARLASITV